MIITRSAATRLGIRMRRIKPQARKRPAYKARLDARAMAKYFASTTGENP